MKRAALWMCTLALAIPATASAGQTRQVGPDKAFKRLSQALRAAKDGDVIEIDAAGTYENDAVVIRTNNLTIRGVGKGRARLVHVGLIPNRKGIVVQAGHDLTVENVAFVGARVRDNNGCGIRAQARGLTVRNCRFYDCQDGIQGGAGEILIERCEFDHCGHSRHPVTHSCYISGGCTKLIFRHNYSTHTHVGHLLKTRARESWVLYNRLTDEAGTGSAVADFPNGGLVVMVGNVLHKGPKGENNRLIAYGMEGVKHERNGLYVIHNTMLWANRRQAWFVRVENAPEALTPVIRNNVCVGPIPLTNSARADAAGNLLLKSVEAARFAAPAEYDFRLQAGSPCIDAGAQPGKVGTTALAPEFQYVHPCNREKRPADGKPDIGAYEFSPQPERPQGKGTGP